MLVHGGLRQRLETFKHKRQLQPPKMLLQRLNIRMNFFSAYGHQSVSDNKLDTYLTRRVNIHIMIFIMNMRDYHATLSYLKIDT